MAKPRAAKSKETGIPSIVILARLVAIVALALVAIWVFSLIAGGKDSQSLHFAPLESGLWQQCLVFEAPSLTVPGNGMFAARRLKKHDLAWFAPLYVRFEKRTMPHSLRKLMLDHYMLTQAGTDDVVAFGSSTIINHHREPNVNYIETTNDGVPSHSPVLIGFQANRDIEPGEELFFNYGDQNDPSGWFRARGLNESTAPHKQSWRESWKSDAAERCSKMAAGVGRESLKRIEAVAPSMGRLLKHMKLSLPPDDLGWGGAIARTSIAAGESIQIDSMLVLPADMLRNTMLAPLLFEYGDLTSKHRQSLSDLRKKGLAKMYYNDGDHVADGKDIWQDDNVALLPLGNIVMVQRVGLKSKAANCEVDIAASESGRLEMRLRATRHLRAGEALALAFPMGGGPSQRLELMRHIMRYGQPMPGMPAAWRETADASALSRGTREL